MKKKTKFKIVMYLLSLLIVFFIGYKGKDFLNGRLAPSEKGETKSTAAKTVTKPDSLQVNQMYFGDVFWGRYINDWAMASDLKEKYPFSGLNTFNREDYQAWIGSLNCPITANQVPSETQNDLLMFNCTPNYLAEAKKWFNIFSLANSHTDNQNGMVGFTSTRNYLDQNGIQYFGHNNKDVTDEICEIVSIKSKALTGAVNYENKNYDLKDFYVPIAMCGYHNTFSLPTEAQLDEIAKYVDLFPTFVYAIQGPEYPIEADDLQKAYFRMMIDRGADAVIGKGAHVVQNTESYKGKPIIYSMGNFVYDQQFSEDVRQGIGVKVKIDLTYDENMEKWQQIASTCTKFKDSCQKKAKELNLSKPKYTVAYDIVATDNSAKLAKKASDTVLEKMLERTRWKQTLAGLGKEEEFSN